jgi:hypothetical protein
MEPFSRIVEEWNEAGVGFLMVELDAALTFLDLADTTTRSDVAHRNRDNAHEAYQTLLRYADRVRMEGVDKANFNERLGRLRTRLCEAGYRV